MTSTDCFEDGSMNSATFTRVTSPGLPSWPSLLLDTRHKRAVVSIRLATWRSWLWAHRASLLMGWCVNLWAGWWVWEWSELLADPLVGGCLAVLGFGVGGALTKPLFPPALDGFLARQVFASRSRVWFTPEVIAFRSRLYTNGVLLWRRWRDQPVQFKFDITSDPEAAEQRSAMTPAQAALGPRLQSAHLLRLVISTFDPSRVFTQATQANVVRSLPLLEVDLCDAQRLTVVLSTAAALTAAPVTRTVHQPGGVDIDASPSLNPNLGRRG
jgi:hypothetical protein